MKKLFVIVTFALIMQFTALTGEPHAATNIIDFEIEIDLKGFKKFDIEYEVKNENKIEAKYAIPGKVTAYGKNAVTEVEKLLNELQINENSDLNETKQKIIKHFNIKEGDIEDFEIEVKFDTGKKIKLEQ